MNKILNSYRVNKQTNKTKITDATESNMLPSGLELGPETNFYQKLCPETRI